MHFENSLIFLIYTQKVVREQTLLARLGRLGKRPRPQAILLWRHTCSVKGMEARPTKGVIELAAAAVDGNLRHERRRARHSAPRLDTSTAPSSCCIVGEGGKRVAEDNQP